MLTIHDSTFDDINRTIERCKNVYENHITKEIISTYECIDLNKIYGPQRTRNFRMVSDRNYPNWS